MSQLIDQVNTNYDVMDEAQLISRCQSGDLQAFNSLIRRYESKVLNQASRYLRDYHIAFDEAQEIFLKVFKKIQLFKGESSFSTWLYRVTANHCLNVIEKQKRQYYKQHVSLQSGQDGIGESQTEDKQAKSPEQIAEETSQANQMILAIDQLPADLKKMIILRHYEEMTYEEIAELLNVPTTTVCSSLYRARQQLKDLINRKGEDRK